jgi:putative endonuclease
MSGKIIAGNAAEELAARYLQDAALVILERNYRCKLGEIDIIARDGETLVFVEVRLRRQRGFGEGFDTVDRRKQQKLIRTAKLFLQERKFFDQYPCRFDIVSIQSLTELNWIKDAFLA